MKLYPYKFSRVYEIRLKVNRLYYDIPVNFIHPNTIKSKKIVTLSEGGDSLSIGVANKDSYYHHLYKIHRQ